MIGDILCGRYSLIEDLGADQIMHAFIADDSVVAREVTVRTLKPEFAGGPDLVSAVSKIIFQYGEIDHPGVERILEIDADQGQTFLVCQPSRGVPLADRIKKLAPFSVPVAVSTALSLCADLEVLHHQGLIHGDLNAQTVLALPDGQVKLLLPGFWSAYASTPQLAVAASQLMAPYLAPEVSSGGALTSQSDMYAVGILLYQLLTGRLPYNADTATAMALKHATATVPTTKLFNQAVPGVLDEIIKKCLAKEPVERYQDAADLSADLQILQDALRFGKTISWPLRPASVSAPVQMPKQPVQNKVVKKAEPAPRSVPVKRVKEPRDVPMVMVILISVFAAVVLTMLGIWIAFSYSRPNLITVPVIKDLTVEDATAALRKAKLQIRVAGEKMNDKIAAGHIASSEPPGGDQLRENGTVFVTVSSGSRYVRVPNLKGMTVDEARSLLKGKRLDLDDQIDQKQSANVEAGKIISQDPPADAKEMKSVLEQGSRIRVTVSNGSTDMSATPSTSSPSSLYTLKVKLTGLEEPVTLRVDIEDERGIRTVYEQDHPPETTVNLNVRGTGERVKFRIYYNDELVREVEQMASEAQPLRGSGER